MKPLFICRSNVARSQMAQAYYNYFTKTNDAYSAGTNPDGPRNYPIIPPYLINLMKEEYIDMSHQRPKLVDKVMVDNAEKIFIMCEKWQCPEYLRNSEKTIFWEIQDPRHITIGQTRKIRNQIRKKVKSIT